MENYYNILLEKLKKTDAEGKEYIHLEYLNDLIGVLDNAYRMDMFAQLEKSAIDRLKNDKEAKDKPESSQMLMDKDLPLYKSVKYQFFIKMQSILAKHGITVKAEDMQEVLNAQPSA